AASRSSPQLEAVQGSAGDCEKRPLCGTAWFWSIQIPVRRCHQMSPFARVDREERFLASKTDAEANNSSIVPIRGIARSNGRGRELGAPVVRDPEFICFGQCVVTYFFFIGLAGFWRETVPSALWAIPWHISVPALLLRL